MRHHALLALLSFLCAASACGPGSEDPAPCTDAFGMYEDSEEFDSPDGCVTYVCNDGLVETVDDRRASVAGDLALATQEAVDAQSCLGVVEGTLRISGTAADLSPLAALYRVGAGLEITGSQAVSTAGLQTLGELGGSFTLADNASLTTLVFHPYMSVFGDATIQNNDVLTALAGAEFLGQCGTCIGVSSQPTELVPAVPGHRDAGFAEPTGGTFYGAILIADNDVLTDVYALGNLYYAWSDVRFRNNDMLTSLAGLQMVEVRGALEISEHAAMTTLEAETFAARVSVLGGTTICGNLDGAACP